MKVIIKIIYLKYIINWKQKKKLKKEEKYLKEL